MAVITYMGGFNTALHQRRIKLKPLTAEQRLHRSREKLILEAHVKDVSEKKVKSSERGFPWFSLPFSAGELDKSYIIIG